MLQSYCIFIHPHRVEDEYRSIIRVKSFGIVDPGIRLTVKIPFII